MPQEIWIRRAEEKFGDICDYSETIIGEMIIQFVYFVRNIKVILNKDQALIIFQVMDVQFVLLKNLPQKAREKNTLDYH